MYFSKCNNLEELRTEYKTLLKKYHPDNGGDAETCKAINVEYKKAFERLKNNAGVEEETADKKKWNEEADEKIREQIFNFIHFESLNIEIIGCWIWIDGDTFQYREELKSYGFKWSKNRKKWHWTSEEATEHCYFKGKKSFEQLRSKYGSTRVQQEEAAKLA